MDIVEVYCVVLIIVWVIVSFGITKYTSDYINPMSFLIYLYLLNDHIKMIATKHGIADLNSNIYGIKYQLLALVLSDIGLAIVVASFYLFNARSRGYKISAEKGLEGLRISPLFFVLVFLACGVIAYGPLSFVRITSLEKMKMYRIYRDATSLGNGMRIVWVNLITISFLSLIYCIFMRNSSKINKLIQWIAIGAMTLYIFANQMSKTVVLMVPISIFFFHNLRKIRETGRGLSIKPLLAITIPCILCVSLIEIIDAGKTQTLGIYSIIYNFFVPSFDVIDNLSAILSQVGDLWKGEMVFKPFLYNVFVSKIPRSIFPSKYIGGAKVMIVERYLSKYWNSLTGEYTVASPSFVGDAILSGGLLFFLVICVIYGIIFKKIYSDAINSYDWPPNVLYVYSIIMMNEFIRGGSGILGQLLLYLILICFLKFLAKFRIRQTVGSN